MKQAHMAALAALAIGLFPACWNTSSHNGSPFSPGIPGEEKSTDDSLLENFSGDQMLPRNNWWNLDISQAPVDSLSSSFIDSIGSGQELHPDMAHPPWGIPYIGVCADEPLSLVTFTGYASESDSGAPGMPPGYPIPEEAKTRRDYIENGAAGGHTSGDRHMLLIDRDRWILYELDGAHWTGSRWEATSGAVFDLKSNRRRPEGWTSTDAAGLAVFPGLVRYDEVVASGPITHAFRVATSATDGHVWPASHTSGETPGAPPLGTRLRLKASVDISGYPPEIQKIFQAMKTYGLIIADNGGNMYVTGTMDSRWDNGVLNPAFHSLHADDFEVIQLGWGATLSP
jgi:hypothetical protein